ncbi:MAG: hypothetical protein WDA16_12345 [Candidatus Thermoplasmatota archaeon]
MTPRRHFTIAFVATLALTTALPSAHAALVESPVFLHEIQGLGFHMIVQSNSANVGDTIRFTAFNQGTDHDNAAHEVVFCGDGPTPSNSCRDQWASSGLIFNNQTAVIDVPAKRAGDFAIYCDLRGHAAAGMAEVFRITGDTTTPKTSGGGALIGTLIALAGVAVIHRTGKK